jgi:hypothetical protein
MPQTIAGMSRQEVIEGTEKPERYQGATVLSQFGRIKSLPIE